MSVTLIITVITVLVSLAAFQSQKMMDDLIFYPPAVTQKKQYYRFITCGFIHADFMHLAFNMISFYLFSDGLVEPAFISYFGEYGKPALVLMYVAALVVCLLPTYFKNKNNQNYRSLGASGAVSAVVFAGLMISPLTQVGFFIIPPIIPGFIFGPLFLVISFYMDKRGSDNVNHSAHIWGALFGLAFIIIATKLYSHTDIVSSFVQDVRFWFKSKFNLG
ncbi:MAG TPA: rhomboid family intramembrane serine protease [Hanamia sp.]